MMHDRSRVRLTTALWAIATGLLAPAMTHAGDGFCQLIGPEITAQFTGMEFTDEVHWGLIFAPGRRLTSSVHCGSGCVSTSARRYDFISCRISRVTSAAILPCNSGRRSIACMPAQFLALD